jgi:hypothetical protein
MKVEKYHNPSILLATYGNLSEKYVNFGGKKIKNLVNWVFFFSMKNPLYRLKSKFSGPPKK